MLCLCYRDHPKDETQSEEFGDLDWNAASARLVVVCRYWKEVWLYLEDDENPRDWIAIFDNTEENA